MAPRLNLSHTLAAALLILSASACSGGSASDPLGPETGISLYALVQTVDGTSWYPPLGPQPVVTGPFDASLLNQLSLVLESTSRTNELRTVAIFDSRSSPSLTVSSQFEAYYTFFPAATYFTDSTLSYRFRILLSGAELGRSDLDGRIFDFIRQNPSFQISVKVRIEARPAPSISTLTPSSVPRNSAGITLTVAGSNFGHETIIRFAGQDYVTMRIDATHLSASLPASLFTVPGTYGVQTFTPRPGGGTSASATFTVFDPPPTAGSVTPNSAIAGSASFDITIDGSNFTDASSARFDGNALPTRYLSDHQLSATLSTGLFELAGTHNVSVVNPPNLSSGTVSFAVSNPVPSLNSISPTSVVALGPSFTLTVNGERFTRQSAIVFDGAPLSTSYDSPGQLRATISSDAITIAANHTVSVNNPAPGGGATALSLTLAVTNPVPSLTSISPSSVLVGSAGLTLTCDGSSFVNGAHITWNGTALTTTYVSAFRLTAPVSAAMLATAGTATIVVDNPEPFPVSSGFRIFTVQNPAPQITSTSPTEDVIGTHSHLNIIINGSNFIDGATATLGGVPALTTTFISSTRLNADMPGSALQVGGHPTLTVSNPAPAAGSASTAFSVYYPIPTITSLSRTSVPVGSAPFTLTIEGANFYNLPTLSLNDRELAFRTWLSSTRVIVTVPADFMNVPGDFIYIMRNPLPSVGYTAPITFTVTPAACNDGVKNGDETQVDCGGSTCLPCVLQNCTPGDPSCTELSVGLRNLGGIASASDTAGGLTPASINDGLSNSSVPGWGNNTQADSRLMIHLAREYDVFELNVFWGGNNSGWHAGTNDYLPAQFQVQYSTDPAASVNDPDNSSRWTALRYPEDLLASSSGSASGTELQPGFTNASWNTLETISFNRVHASAIRLVFDGTPANDSGTNRVGLVAELDVVAAVSPDGSTCANGSSCASGVCTAGLCASPVCNDFVPNGTETDVDCGGTCAGCAVGQFCFAGTDCAERVCANGTCAAPTCTDGQRNGVETDVDCGGTCAQRCDAGDGCSVNADCASGICTAGVCAAASCFDLVRNGSESDVDCGGSCALRCDDGLRCNVNLDCSSDRCAGAICQVPVPSIATLTPASADAGAAGFTLALHGNYFRASSEVTFNGTPLAINFSSSTDLSIDIPASLVANAGTYTISVHNPGSTGNGTASYNVYNPAPVLSGFTPASAVAGAASFTITVDGASFVPGAVVHLNGSTLATTLVSAAQLTATVPSSLIGTGGFYNLNVTNPDPAHGASVTRTFTVNNPVPTISALSPNNAPVGRGTLAVTISGTGFQAGAQATFNGSGVSASLLSSTQLSASIPAAMLAVAGSYPVTVSNGTPGGGTSAAATFTVNAALCTDTIRNGAETDTDCGGGCPGCAPGRVCSVGNDCQSSVCTTGLCQAPLCTDGVKNGSETDLDCGGTTCPMCASGRACLVGADCTSGVCSGGVCQAPSCTDGVRNGGEGGIDCGGSCPNPCVIEACGSGGNCTSCLAILEGGLSQGSGVYSIDPDGSGPIAPFATYCDMTTDGGGWSLAAKLSAAAMSAAATDPRTAMYAGNLNVGNVAYMNRGNQTQHYSTPLANAAWGNFSESRYEVIDGGAVAQFLVFNSSATTPGADFTRSKLKYDSWNDLFKESQNYFSKDGDSANSRYFFVQRNYGGCPSDAGWMAVKAGTGASCAWEVGSRNYSILYAHGTGYKTNVDTVNYTAASALALWVRERPPVTSRASCLEILEGGASIGDGVYTIDPDRNGSSIPVYCDMTTAGGGWTMVYKHSAGTTIPATAADFIGVNYLGGNLNETNTTLLNKSRSTLEYANRLMLRHWGRFSEARMEVAVGGAAAQYMRYANLLGSGPETFYARSYLVESSWGDLLVESQNFWAPRGDEGNRRHWYVNRNYGGCGSDAGWVIANQGTGCSWESTRPNSILYSTSGGYQNWTTGSVGQADALVLLMREHVPVTYGLAPRTCQAWLTAGFTTSGMYNIDPTQSGVNIAVYCDMVTDGGGWALAWKHSSGLDRDIGADIAGANLNPSDTTLMTRNLATRDFASTILASYRFPQFTQARFEVLVGGAVRRYFVHNAVGQTARGVMSRSTLLRTDWTDITTNTQNFFSIDGDTSCRRHGFINRSYGGCSVDNGWLAALQGTGCNCGWESANANQIMYATPTTVQNWTSGSVARADALVMWVR